MGESTGNFGPMTMEAVMKLQKEKGISPTNCVGPMTRGKFDEDKKEGKMREVKITPEAIRIFQLGVFSAERLVAHGFATTTELKWEVINGSLPQGVTLFKTQMVASCASGGNCNVPFSNDISIQGQPTTIGEYEFTVRVSDGTRTAERRYVIRVKSGGATTSTSATVQ